VLRTPHLRDEKFGVCINPEAEQRWRRYTDSPGFNLASYVQGGTRKNESIIALSG
jgi:hypothetical protein